MQRTVADDESNPGKSALRGREATRNKIAHWGFCTFRSTSRYACLSADSFQALSLRAITFSFKSKIPTLSGLSIFNLFRPASRTRPPQDRIPPRVFTFNFQLSTFNFQLSTFNFLLLTFNFYLFNVILLPSSCVF